MLILNEELWEKDRIIKISCSNIWEKNDTYIIVECVFKRLKELLIDANDTKREGILICDCNKGTFPPVSHAINIVSYMVSIKKYIENGLACTIIYAKSDEHIKFINNILKIYTPAKPVNIVSTKDDIKKKLVKFRK